MTHVSIVFRNKDMSATGKIYADTLEGGATLAASYRSASHFVDVINHREEVALRWENGSPDWKLGQVKPIKLDTPEYNFERNGDWYCDAENRLRLLSEALEFAFDTAVGQPSDYNFESLEFLTDQHGWDDIWNLIRDARIVAEEAEKTTNPADWTKVIDQWMADTNRLFVSYRVEYAALLINLSEIALHDRVPRLGVELATLEAKKSF